MTTQYKLDKKIEELQKEQMTLHTELNKKRTTPCVKSSSTNFSPLLSFNETFPYLSVAEPPCPICKFNISYETVVIWKECGHQMIQHCKDVKLIQFFNLKKDNELWFDK
jgi:hypothetical protein